MKTRKLMWLGMLSLSLVFCALQGRAQEEPKKMEETIEVPPTELVATLTKDENPLPPHLVQLRLSVKNRGTNAIHLLRLRSGWLEYNAGSLHNWSIQLDGPQGTFRFPFYTGLILPLTENDLLELRPGESFSTPIVLDEASFYRVDGLQQPLNDTPGAYTVSVSGGAPDFPLDIKANVLSQNLHSNVLKFSVE